MRRRPDTLSRSVAFLLAAIVISTGQIAAPQAQPRRPADPILILVSFDGWRWDYSDRFDVPNLRALASRGVRVTELVPSFPALTFPNHYTIATGLYPEHHGIIGNAMTDARIGTRFSSSSDAVKDARWWQGEPIWVTAIRQGRRAAGMFWPGTEAAIQGIRPTYWRPFVGTLGSEARVAQVLEWLALSEDERPSLVTLYQDIVDHAGHDFGPDSREVADAAATLDRTLGTLISGIRRIGLDDRTTLVIVSDHGMTEASPDRQIWLDELLDLNTVDVTEWEGILELTPRKPTSVDEIYARLRSAHPHLHVYTRDTMPKGWHYGQNTRIPPIVGVPDDGWLVTTHERRRQRLDAGRAPIAGVHGFDPADPRMHGIFVAAGPSLTTGLVVPSLDNVNVYDFLCRVLGLTPAPNDGDPATTRAFAK